MRLPVVQISVLGVLLFLIGRMNQKIEAMRIRFAFDDCQEVSLVEYDYLMYRLGKRIQ